jgi:hypothetical protein
VDGRRFRMQDLERAQHPTTSGLREVPVLRFGPAGSRTDGSPR